MMFYILFVLPAVLCAIKVLWYLYTKPWHHIPSPKGEIPFLGHLLIVPTDRADLVKYIEELHCRNGPSFIFWILWKPVLASIDVDLYKMVLQSSQLITKGSGYNMLHDWLGTGLLTSTGEKWKERRKLLTPAFHYDTLSKNAFIIEKHAKRFSEFLNTESYSGKDTEIFKVTKYFALDVICETAMGVIMNTLTSNDNTNDHLKERKYIEIVHDLAQNIAQRYTKPWFWSPFIYSTFSSEGKKYYQNLNTINCFISSIIDKQIQRRLEIDTKNESHLFLDVLLDAYSEGKIDKTGILEEVHTFMFEGYDTVSAAISWTFYMLAIHKSAQRKAYEEIKLIDKSDLSCLDKLKQMKYIEYVIKESLRIHPSVPLILRMCEEDTSFKKLNIPKGTEIAFHLLHMQRDDAVWKDASKFIPERFDEHSFVQRNPFAYLPFSAGQRNCIGQKMALVELKLFVYYTLRNFEIDTNQKESDLREEIDAIHRTQNGLWLKFHPRSSV